MKNAALGLFLQAVLLLIAPLHAAPDPASFPNLAFRQHPGAQLPSNAILVDASGHSSTLAEALASRPTVLVLEYLRCNNLCGLVLSGAMRAIADSNLKPGSDVDLVAISIDPRDRTSDVAAAQAMYATRFFDGKAIGVRFFTASPDQLRKIVSAVGFPYRYDQASDQFLHPAGFVVTTPGGRISRYLLGLNPKSDMLRQAVAEAALEKVEPPAHPLLCLCFGYDPDEGSVAGLTLRLVRYAAFGIALAVAALIAMLSLRRRTA